MGSLLSISSTEFHWILKSQGVMLPLKFQEFPEKKSMPAWQRGGEVHSGSAPWAYWSLVGLVISEHAG